MKKKILRLGLVIFGALVFSGCGSSAETMSKEDLHDELKYSANGFANLLLDTQTKNEAQEYYDKKIDSLIEEIEENTKRIKKAKTEEKSLKNDVMDYNDLVVLTLMYFYEDEGGEYSFEGGELLREIVDTHFDGKLPDRFQVLVNYSDAQERKTSEEAEAAEKAAEEQAESAALEKEQEAAKKAEEEKNASDITLLAETPTPEQASILTTLAEQQFNAEYPYKGSKIRTIMGVIQDWTKLDDQWYYKVQVVIVNAYGAELETTAEFKVTPVDASSGIVSILVY